MAKTVLPAILIASLSELAATSCAHGAALVTRNTKDFQHTGVGLIDPWQDSE
jgi:predicted nucleic acid-binding protein